MKLAQREAHRAKLEPLYAELIDRYRGLKDQSDAEGFFTEFVTPLLMSGSDDVIKAWVDFQRAWARAHPAGQADDDTVDIQSMLAFETVLRAIRKELGHSNSDLAPGDLLRVYINDLDQYLPTRSG